ncbi:unnamed protein product [Nippostrongylus brasiliensis]|uniref:Uncharacterized protein n=1 Tax=Nippostrongylus brasiliensis TaxID=27835 RepID=A0A0N4YF46_NIPBR|nr:unnamed protein product [Nippostrongylus brasiliensis]
MGKTVKTGKVGEGKRGVRRRVEQKISSAGACPLLVVGSVCPQENPLYYFKCCGDLNSSCCFRLQVCEIVSLLTKMSTLF